MIFSVLFGPQLSFSISFQCLQIFLISLEKLFISLSYLLYYQSLAEGDCVVRCKCCRITDCSVRSSRLMVKCGTCADCQHLRGRLRMPPQRGEASVAMPMATLLSLASHSRHALATHMRRGNRVIFPIWEWIIWWGVGGCVRSYNRTSCVNMQFSA